MVKQSEEVWDSPTDWVGEHVRKYVESNGANGHDFNGYAALLLTTRGRRSGKLRRTALIYGREDGDYVIVASNGGAATHPSWYLNLTEEPLVHVQAGAETFDARARTAGPAERPGLWRKMTELFTPYVHYQQGNEREIPVVVLEPVSPSPAVEE